MSFFCTAQAAALHISFQFLREWKPRGQYKGCCCCCYVWGTLPVPQDLQYGAVPALFAAFSSALRVQPPDELRLLAVGLDRRDGGGRASLVCEDDPRVAEMGYSCSMMEAFCDSKLHDLAAAQKKQLPSWLPKDAKVKDACRKTCGACGRFKIVELQKPLPIDSVLRCIFAQAIPQPFSSKKIETITLG